MDVQNQLEICQLSTSATPRTRKMKLIWSATGQTFQSITLTRIKCQRTWQVKIWINLNSLCLIMYISIINSIIASLNSAILVPTRILISKWLQLFPFLEKIQWLSFSDEFEFELKFPELSQAELKSFLVELSQTTVVGRAPFNTFSKKVLNKVFYVLVIKFKFYTWIIIFSSDRVK